MRQIQVITLKMSAVLHNSVSDWHWVTLQDDKLQTAAINVKTGLH